MQYQSPMMYTLITLVKAVWISCSRVCNLVPCKSQSPKHLRYRTNIIVFHILQTYITFLNSVCSLVANRKSLKDFHRPVSVQLDLYLKFLFHVPNFDFDFYDTLPFA